MLNIIHHGALCNRSTSIATGTGIGLGNGGGAVVVKTKSGKRSSACSKASHRVGLGLVLAGTSASAAGIVVAVAVLASCFSCSTFTAAVLALDTATETESTDTLSNVPQTLSGDDCKKPLRIQRPKSKKAESCTIKCLTTCIRGGQGSPGEGPFNVRRPLVVFKQGFRSRRYCLVECSDICNLIGDGEDGP
ncbi:uncharacterized protein LOC107428075 [Ziziphus jujuba]|uniref:Uncharacterized protein LOC107428075 n=2 Tax=Ziziphus jujuba TaxID=326968 RepID=A0A6P6GJU0_ZIZJJ|nr:uncharacterized protein LOC107428075 [Ziziphus jujuba]KAH7515233.1 hypothetical protein FEM48_Zijuj10G0005200 [Ziziphus jujuba var. spinosa]